MIYLLAIFTGRDNTSFKNGAQYTLSLTIYENSIFVKSTRSSLSDSDINIGSYVDIDSFIDDWEIEKIYTGVTGSAGASGRSVNIKSRQVGNTDHHLFAQSFAMVQGAIGSMGTTGSFIPVGNKSQPTIGKVQIPANRNEVSDTISKLKSSIRNSKIDNLLT